MAKVCASLEQILCVLFQLHIHVHMKRLCSVEWRKKLFTSLKQMCVLFQKRYFILPNPIVQLLLTAYMLSTSTCFHLTICYIFGLFENVLGKTSSLGTLSLTHSLSRRVFLASFVNGDQISKSQQQQRK